MSPGLADYQIDGAVAVVAIDNPPANALSLKAREDLALVFKALGKEKGLRAVVLHGRGNKGFSTGADLSNFNQLEPETALPYISRSQRAYAAVAGFPLPVIAAIHGFCLGGAFELALCCDIRVADVRAKLGFPEANLSLFPGNQGLPRAVFQAPLGAIKKLAFTGRIIGAKEALSLGLIEEISPQGEYLEQALSLAREISQKPPLGVAQAKRTLNQAWISVLRAQADEDRQAWAELTGSAEFKEAISAFLEKRPPRFDGD